MWIIPILSYSLLYWLSCCGSPCPHKRHKKIILGRCGPLPSCLFSAWCRVVHSSWVKGGVIKLTVKKSNVYHVGHTDTT